MSDNFIDIAQRHMDKGAVTRAFFCLALEAIRQLARIADAQEKISKRMDAWEEDGTMSVTNHGRITNLGA